jgi:hypothetical protein
MVISHKNNWHSTLTYSNNSSSSNTYYWEQLKTLFSLKTTITQMEASISSIASKDYKILM